MAREMALAGVSKEELQPDNTPQEPLTPKQKWQNFWYYYRWWVLAAVALVIILFICTWQMLSTVKPDYFVVMVTKDVMDENSLSGLEDEFAEYGKDINGDNKVVVRIENLSLAQYVGGTRNALAETNAQKLMAYLMAADSMFFIFDDACYNDYLGKLKESAENGVFFDKLNVKDAGYNEQECYWNWTNDERSSSFYGMDMPKDLYFGIRYMGGTASGSSVQEKHDTCKELLERFITKTK